MESFTNLLMLLCITLTGLFHFVYTQDVDCKNHHELCEFWASEGDCDRESMYMVNFCKGACRPECQLYKNRPVSNLGPLPGRPKVFLPNPASCRDKHDVCKGWAEKGDCNTIPIFMKNICPRSCGLCLDQQQSLIVGPAPQPSNPSGQELTLAVPRRLLTPNNVQLGQPQTQALPNQRTARFPTGGFPNLKNPQIQYAPNRFGLLTPVGQRFQNQSLQRPSVPNQWNAGAPALPPRLQHLNQQLRPVLQPPRFIPSQNRFSHSQILAPGLASFRPRPNRLIQPTSDITKPPAVSQIEQVLVPVPVEKANPTLQGPPKSVAPVEIISGVQPPIRIQSQRNLIPPVYRQTANNRYGLYGNYISRSLQRNGIYPPSFNTQLPQHQAGFWQRKSIYPPAIPSAQQQQVGTWQTAVPASQQQQQVSPWQPIYNARRQQVSPWKPVSPTAQRPQQIGAWQPLHNAQQQQQVSHWPSTVYNANAQRQQSSPWTRFGAHPQWRNFYNRYQRQYSRHQYSRYPQNIGRQTGIQAFPRGSAMRPPFCNDQHQNCAQQRQLGRCTNSMVYWWQCPRTCNPSCAYKRA